MSASVMAKLPKKPAAPDLLRICDRGETCPNRGIPLVDLYLTCSGAMWMHNLGVSAPFAKEIAAWAALAGVAVQFEEPSSEPAHQRHLFSDDHFGS